MSSYHAVDIPDVLNGCLVGHMTDSCHVQVITVGESPMMFRGISATINMHFFRHADGKWKAYKPGENAWNHWGSLSRCEGGTVPPATAKHMLLCVSNMVQATVTEQDRLLGAQAGNIEARKRAEAEAERLKALYEEAMEKFVKIVNAGEQINARLDGKGVYVMRDEWVE